MLILFANPLLLKKKLIGFLERGENSKNKCVGTV